MEEALVKSRGHRAHRSWKLKKANAALARTLEEEEYESSREPASKDSNMYNFPYSPSSRLETPPVESATMPEDSTPIPEHSESRRKKRKPKAHLENSQKRRKVASESSSAEEDFNTAEEMAEAAHKDKNSQTDAYRGSISRSVRTSPIVEIITHPSSTDSLQREEKFAAIPFSLPNPAPNATPENDAAIGEVEKAVSKIRDPTTPSTIAQSSVPIVSAIVEKAETVEELAEVLHVESTQHKPAASPNSARRDSARDEADNVQSIPHDDSHSPATIDYGSR